MRTLRCLLLAICLTAIGLGPPPIAHAQDAITGTWMGRLQAGGAELRLVFHIQRGAGDSLTATMDSPDQGVTGVPVSRVRVDGDSLLLAVNRIGGRFEGVLVEDRSAIKGRWHQSGRSFPLALTPADAAATAPTPRPQHPEPPYPYASEDVTFRNEAAGITLAGTLTRPEGDGPHPAVVLVSGSGPQNRNSTVFGHKLFLVLADHLTRHGIAVLRYDERGIGESGGALEGATSENLARDAAAAVRFLEQRPAIDSSAVGLLGISEGGLIAPMVHTRFEETDYLVLLSAPSVSGADIIAAQSALIAERQGAPTATVDSIRRTQQRLLEAIRTAPDSAAAAARLRSILDAQGMADEQIQSTIQQMTTPWFRYFVRYDPAAALRQVDVPVLALYGSKDVQVPPAQNLAPMRAALAKSPSDDVTVRVLDGLNHLLQPADSGLPSEYAQIETTMAPAALQAITDWIQAHTAAGK